MDETLKSFLEEKSIKYKIHEHPRVFTVAESSKIIGKTDYLRTKNLFLTDEDGRFYLVCMNALKKLNIRALEKYLKIKKLNFGSPEELKKELNIFPGSVSIFNLIYAKNVKLLVSKEVWGAEKIGAHPNDNDATLEINHSNLEKYLKALEIEIGVFEVE